MWRIYVVNNNREILIFTGVEELTRQLFDSLKANGSNNFRLYYLENLIDE